MMLIILGKLISFALGSSAALKLLASEAQGMDDGRLWKKGLSFVPDDWKLDIVVLPDRLLGLLVKYFCALRIHVSLFWFYNSGCCCICVFVSNVVVGKHVARNEPGEREIGLEWSVWAWLEQDTHGLPVAFHHPADPCLTSSIRTAQSWPLALL